MCWSKTEFPLTLTAAAIPVDENAVVYVVFFNLFANSCPSNSLMPIADSNTYCHNAMLFSSRFS